MNKTLLLLLVGISISAQSQNKQMIDQMKLSNGKTILIFSDKTWEYKAEKTRAYTNSKNQKAYSSSSFRSNIPSNKIDSIKSKNDSVAARPKARF